MGCLFSESPEEPVFEVEPGTGIREGFIKELDHGGRLLVESSGLGLVLEIAVKGFAFLRGELVQEVCGDPFVEILHGGMVFHDGSES